MTLACRVFINGRSFLVPQGVSYSDVVRLIGLEADRLWTITVHYPEGKGLTLTPGKSVVVTDGTRFNIADTSSA